MQDTFHIHDVLGNECFDSISSDTWFDVASSIYCFAVRIISDEAQFVATYLMSGDEETDNPNLSEYARFEESMYQIISGCDNPHYPTPEILSLIRGELELVVLASYQDDRKCACGLLFQVIKAIDRIIKDTTQPSSVCVRLGPLNDVERESVGLYLRSNNHFIDDFFFDCLISSRLDYGSLNEQLTSLVFFRKEEGFALPQIIPSCSLYSSIESTRSIKVAVAPVRGEGIQFSDEPNRDPDICFEFKRGSAFGCNYSGEYARRFDGYLTTIVERAVNAGCVALVLPEFVITDEVVGKLRQVLCDADDLGALQLVVAGSWWNPVDNHNVGALVFAKGKHVRLFDKYVCYTKNEPKGNCTEILERTEKRTVLIDVPGIGLILPQICRDIVEHEKRADMLAKIFHPAMILAPSWSNSIIGAFKPSLSDLALRHNVVSVIANACGARRESVGNQEGGQSISLCVSPAIDTTGKSVRKSLDPLLCNMSVSCLDSCSLCCDNVWIVTVSCKESVDAEDGTKPEISVTSELLLG